MNRRRIVVGKRLLAPIKRLTDESWESTQSEYRIRTNGRRSGRNRRYFIFKPSQGHFAPQGEVKDAEGDPIVDGYGSLELARVALAVLIAEDRKIARLISDAAEAEEHVPLDELEAHAKKQADEAAIMKRQRAYWGV